MDDGSDDIGDWGIAFFVTMGVVFVSGVVYLLWLIWTDPKTRSIDITIVAFLALWCVARLMVWWWRVSRHWLRRRLERRLHDGT